MIDITFKGLESGGEILRLPDERAMNMTGAITFESANLMVRPWEDEVIDRIGFDPRTSYVESFWLGVIGPSATWLLRRMAAGFDASPEGFKMSLGETARAIGLGIAVGATPRFSAR